MGELWEQKTPKIETKNKEKKKEKKITHAEESELI